MNADEKYNLIRFFKINFNYEPNFFACAPGRVELLGNHLDHQGGKVLASSVNLFMRAAFNPNNSNIVNIVAKGFESISLNLEEIGDAPTKNEKGTTLSLVRGIITGFAKDYEIKGFDAYIETDVQVGSGLSSSAAFEVLIGRILNELFAEGKVDAKKIAKIGQLSENNYYGKPSGLMDQMASSVGGIIYIDFKDNKNPDVQKIDFDFKSAGYYLLIIDSKSSHEGLTNEYAAIPFEMKEVAKAFGGNILSEIDPIDFFDKNADKIADLNPRAVLRATHYFEEIARVEEAFKALRENNIKPFIDAVNLSGESSLNKLQNIKVPSEYFDAYIFAKETLNKLTTEGAIRVNGGGFAGTLLAVVPENILDEFIKEIIKKYPVIIL